MHRLFRHLLSILATTSIATLPTMAQTTDEPSDEAPKTHRRAVSKNVAAALAASMPKYNPPKPEPKRKEPAEMQDMRDIDKPRNKIIRLPEYVVRQDKAPVFRERDINTKDSLKELALKRYFSETGMALSSFNIPFFENLAENYALMLYEQDERLNNISDLNKTADDIDQIDSKSAKEIREATRDTYHRSFDERYRTHHGMDSRHR